MHGAWKRRLASAALATMAGALLATIAPAAVAEAAGFQQATEVLAPPNAASNPSANLQSVSCTSSGNCTGVGEYFDSSGHQQAMVATETSGSWGQAVEVTPPPNAGSLAFPLLQGVSCTSAGNCVAVGWYGDGSGHLQAMAATETGGSWAQAVEVTPPSNLGSNPSVNLNGVSCTSVGNCVGVGSYYDSSAHEQAMAATETGGTWAQAIELSPPSNAGTGAFPYLQSVSCTSAGNCAAVGGYNDSSGHQQVMAATETGGTWAQAVEPTLPSNAGSPAYPNLNGVSCTSAGNCVAVGSYADGSGHNQLMAATETNSVWSRAVEVTAPSNANGSVGSLQGVSCISAGNCVAVGLYDDNSGHEQVLAATETIGTWGQAVEVTAPSNTSSNPTTYLNGASCSSTGSCGAVGFYTDSSGHRQAMAATATAAVDQPLAEQVNGGQLVLSCNAPGTMGYPTTTCPLVTLSPAITLNGTAETASGAASTIYVTDGRGNPAVGWSLSSYMVPTPGNPNASCAGVADFCNSSVASNALASDGQIPAANLSVAAPTCAAWSGDIGNINPAPTPGAGGTYANAPLTLCAASAGQSGGTYTMNTSFTLTVPSSVYAGLYEGTVEYLVS